MKKKGILNIVWVLNFVLCFGRKLTNWEKILPQKYDDEIKPKYKSKMNTGQ